MSKKDDKTIKKWKVVNGMGERIMPGTGDVDGPSECPTKFCFVN